MDECNKCEGWKPKLRKGTRCSDCVERFQRYIDEDWGLQDTIDQRNLNQSLGLCFICGGGLADGVSWSERMCDDCQHRSTNSSWNKEQSFRKSGDTNPYQKVWDNHDDNAGYLVPGFGTMAERMFSKARYHQRLSEAGGPKGRDHAADAAIFFRIAEQMREKENELKRLR